ncbi:hypothetical protein D3C72_2119800 [compost metagenome]
MPHQRHKAARRDVKVDILKHQPILAIGERDIFNRNGAALQLTLIIAIGLTRAVHQLKYALPRHHRLLQHGLLRR